MKIAYLGDNAGTSAEYLKDVLTELEHPFQHVDSQEFADQLDEQYDVYILSDYPANLLHEAICQKIIKQVSAGKRLIMIGGWDSFNGRGKNYSGHLIASILPVTLQEEDDRVNSPQGMLLEKEPSFTSDLPIDWTHPPVICGYNAVEAKANAKIPVWIRPINYDGKTLTLLEKQPLVLTQSVDQGITVACATDLAPHWCGGLVDWGSERRTLNHVEVGDMYINFIRLLLEIE
jgi:uncharacterized membrane protein